MSQELIDKQFIFNIVLSYNKVGVTLHELETVYSLNDALQISAMLCASDYNEAQAIREAKNKNNL